MGYKYNKPDTPFQPVVTMAALSSAFSPELAAASSSHNRQARDLLGSASYGHKDEVIYCPEGIPIKQALYALSAAATAALGFLYRAITIATGRRKRRSLRRDTDDLPSVDLQEESGVPIDAMFYKVSDVFNAGNLLFPPQSPLK